MRKNYFLSLLLLMIAFLNVEAKDRVISSMLPAVADSVAPLKTPTGWYYAGVEGTGRQLNVGWSIPPGAETVTYQIAYSTNGINFTHYTTQSFPSDPISGGYGAFTFNGLDPRTKYWFAVRAAKDTLYAHTKFKQCSTDSLLTGVPNDSLHRYSCWSQFLTVTTRADLPYTPTDLKILDGVTQTSATVSFRDVSIDEHKFIIKRSLDGGTTWEDVIFMNTPDSTRKEYDITYTDNGLQPYTTYIYQVASWNKTGYSTTGVFSQPFRTLPYPPAGPSLLESPKQGLDSIYLEWTNHAFNATFIRIERSVHGGPWTPIVTDWPMHVNWFTDKGVEEGVTYLYRVLAGNEGGLSSASNELYVSTKKRFGPPAPTNLQATNISPTQIDLKWSNTPFGEYNVPTSIRVTRSSTNAIDGFETIATLSRDASSYSDISVSPKGNYWYRVLAYNDFGNGGSEVVTLLTLGPPTAPSNLNTAAVRDSLGNDVITVNWTDNSNDEDYFVLERATDANFTQNLLTATLLKNLTSATSNPFEEGVTYYYRIKSVNKHGESAYASLKSITTFYTVAPNKPYALKASATNATTVALKWSDDSNKEETFVIERSTNGTNYTSLASTLRNVTTYNDITAAASTKYWYRVKAVNPKGSSAYSNVVTVTTPASTNALVISNTNDIWQVYPNPTTDGVRVVLPESMQSKVAIVTVIDKMNREVIKTKIDANQKEYRLDLSNFAEGTYTISIRTADQQISKRVYKY